jgi:hypothetical protein
LRREELRFGGFPGCEQCPTHALVSAFT